MMGKFDDASSAGTVNLELWTRGSFSIIVCVSSRTYTFSYICVICDVCSRVLLCVCVQSYQCSRMCVLFFLMCLPSLPLYVCFQMCALAYLCCNMCVCICQCVLSHQCSHMCALICVFLYMFSSPVCFHFGALSYLCSCRECL